MTRGVRTWLPGRLLALAMACACAGTGEEAGPMGAESEVELPAPATTGTVTVEGALAARRSVRAFTEEPLTLAELGQLLWAAQGVTHAPGRRTAPSAGALYPIELYVVTPDGLYQYRPDGHRMALRSRGDLRGALAIAALDQECVGEAAAVFVLTGFAEASRLRTNGRQILSPFCAATHSAAPRAVPSSAAAG